MRTYIPGGYKISKYRYMELLMLCRQYDELRRKRQDCYGIGSLILSDLPSGGVKTSVVERQAEAAQKFDRQIERIETAAREASDRCEPLYLCLLKNVTRGTAYERLNCPCGRRAFYAMRKKFFYLLDKSS